VTRAGLNSLNNVHRIGRRLEITLQALVTLFSIVFVLKLWRVDLKVPINYWGDTIQQLALVKSLTDGSWFWFVSRLGAPFGLDFVAFPQNFNFSSLWIKALSLMTSEPGLLLNVFWLAAIVATSIFCNISLRSVGVSGISRIPLAALYALMPYALYRNTAHIILTFVFVPIIAALSIEILSQRRAGLPEVDPPKNLSKGLISFACVAIGFDYIYNAFFSSFFLVVAALGSWFFVGKTVAFKKARFSILLICGCAALNLAPSLYSWSKAEKPPNMSYKSIAEAEVLGLKLRHVLTPVATSARESALSFPIENENASAKLGIVGAFGFLLAICFGLLGRRQLNSQRRSWAAGVLLIAGTLFATVGGFGVIFNMLIAPDIRAYNRIIVFLGFFAFAVLGLALDAFFAWSSKYNLGSRKTSTLRLVLQPAMMVSVFAAGIFDQRIAAFPLHNRYDEDRAQFNYERQFVAKIEALANHPSKVFQLPQTSFPPDGGQLGMLPYDHGRPYLWSTTISWSWPGFSARYAAWQETLGAVGGRAFLRNLVASGFDGIWLDTAGYSKANAENLVQKLKFELGAPLVISGSGRYVYFSLAQELSLWAEQKTKDQRKVERERTLNPLRLIFGRDFYEPEATLDGTRIHRWSKNRSQLFVQNKLDSTRHVALRAQVQGIPGSMLYVKVGGSTETIRFVSDHVDLTVSFYVPPNSNIPVDFIYEGQRINAPADGRLLYFAVINLQTVESN
jgi:hypothetical protein